MKTLYLFYSCNAGDIDGAEDLGEAQGIFDEDGTLLHAWSCNDADFRTEYMKPLFTALGYEIDRLPEDRYESAVKQMLDFWGL